MFVKSPAGRLLTALFLIFSLASPALVLAASGQVPVLDSPSLVKMVMEEGKGKVTIISVFASWCPPCKEEMPILVKTRSGVDNKDLLLVGLSVDESLGELKQFIKKYNVNFPVYTGTDELLQALGISGIPHMFIFNRKGELVESFVGLMPEPMFRAILARLLGESGV